MRLGLLTDIHANREAFSACLAHLRAAGAERLVLLGDYVGYGADPVFAVETVADLVGKGAVAVMGNHDAAVAGSDLDMNSLAREAIRWTRDQLGPGHRAFLAALPLVHEAGEVLFAHANGHAPADWGYITSPREAAENFSRTRARLTFCGHVHVPMLYHMSAQGTLEAFAPVMGQDRPLARPGAWLAVLGAVGQARDGIPGAHCALLDTDSLVLRYLRVPYDVETAARKIRQAGLPERLALRLELGR